MLTYGDGVSDINLSELENFHKAHGKTAILSAIQLGGRLGTIEICENNEIARFAEKNKENGGWTNGGFMVLNPEVFDLLMDDSTVFEKVPLEKLAESGQLCAYTHYGFWQCMDIQRDKQLLEDLWMKGNAPWKTWE